MQDRILIHGLRVFAYHGVNPEEKQDGQPFIFDIEADADLRVAGQTDLLSDTVSYAQIIKETVHTATVQSDNLLERVAQRVADALFARFDALTALHITLKKPEAPIRADFDWVGVEIFRTREETGNG
ncbi:MAG: dihydroneopterin aldolase [Clostridia bacterium]|nr:dihydroneopterin aldolase [Clostridia bacterium]